MRKSTLDTRKATPTVFGTDLQWTKHTGHRAPGLINCFILTPRLPGAGRPRCISREHLNSSAAGNKGVMCTMTTFIGLLGFILNIVCYINRMLLGRIFKKYFSYCNKFVDCILLCKASCNNVL